MKAYYWLNIITSPIDGKDIYKKIKYCETNESYYLYCKTDIFPDELDDYLKKITNKRYAYTSSNNKKKAHKK